ncbi:MAG: hypothetical protein ACI8RZ_002712 [Myxococcota bacterium]|jgi:hypothetical protein
MLTTLLAFFSAAQADEIRLNSATAAEFAAVEGIDDSMADRIIALRTDRGQLYSVESLRVLNLDGQTLDRLRSEVIIDLQVDTRRKSYSSADEVLAEFAVEPDVRQVQAMAQGYARTNPELVDGWLTASRRAYLLPKLNLQYEKELELYDTFTYEADDAGDAFIEPYGTRADNDDKYVVKLEWRLDKLVMSSEQIRVINESQDIVKLRDKVLDEVTRLYFDRRRLQVELLLAPAGDLRTQLENELRLQELTANLDALTGGSFTASL